jgi:hypothetical protein
VEVLTARFCYGIILRFGFYTNWPNRNKIKGMKDNDKAKREQWINIEIKID